MSGCARNEANELEEATMAPEIRDKQTECVRCHSLDVAITIRITSYCASCQYNNMLAKFRTHLQSMRLMTPKGSKPPKAIAGCSGNKSSLVLRDMLAEEVRRQKHDELQRRRPSAFDCVELVHIDMSSAALKPNVEDITDDSTKDFSATDLECRTIGIEDVLGNDSIDSRDRRSKLQDILLPLSPTARRSLLDQLRHRFLLKHSARQGAAFLLTAETTSSMAITTLANIAQGRGHSLPNEIALHAKYQVATPDGRCDVVHYKPLQAFLEEEIDFYIKHRSIDVPSASLDGRDSKRDINALVANFVNNLQSNFPATVTTISRTAEKVGGSAQKVSTNLCQLCGHPCGVDPTSWREATAITDLHSSKVDQKPKTQSTTSPNLCYGCLAALQDQRSQDSSLLSSQLSSLAF